VAVWCRCAAAIAGREAQPARRAGRTELGGAQRARVRQEPEKNGDSEMTYGLRSVSVREQRGAVGADREGAGRAGAGPARAGLHRNIEWRAGSVLSFSVVIKMLSSSLPTSNSRSTQITTPRGCFSVRLTTYLIREPDMLGSGYTHFGAAEKVSGQTSGMRWKLRFRSDNSLSSSKSWQIDWQKHAEARFPAFF